MKCKKCGVSFHYCTSCDDERCCDNGYCSDQCMAESDEVKGVLANAEKLINSLSKEQFAMFLKYFSDYYDFYEEIQVLIENRTFRGENLNES